jgi:hypothetical protein
MFLASPDVIRESLGFEDMTDISEAVKSALDASEPLLASMLNTDFTAGEATDIYYLQEPGHEMGQMFVTEFRLTHGLLTELTAAHKASAMTVFDTADAENILTSGLIVDLEKGVIKDLSNRYSRQFVRFTYSYGLPVSEVDERSYDLTVVPLWLQEAAKTQALIFLADSAPVTEANIKLDKAVLGQQLRHQLARKVRYIPLGVMPL